MASLTSCFVSSNKLIPENKHIVKGKKFRFSILTPRLIRIEYNENGKFEDRATSLVVNRTFSDFLFKVEFDDYSVTITTSYFSLRYLREEPITKKTLRIIVNGNGYEWTPGNTDYKNYGTIGYSLDNLDSKLKLDNGLYSRDGYYEVDDSKNFVIDNEMFVERDNNVYDTYLFVYDKDLGLCLQDYFNLTGYPPMIPRYALGSWWYKNEAYSMKDIDDTINKFDEKNIPISVFLLGSRWHDDVANYSYNKELFDMNKIVSFIKEKKQRFGVTIDHSLPINNGDPLFNELSPYIKSDNSDKISLVPLNNEKINLYLNYIVSRIKNSGIDIFNIDYLNLKDKSSLFLLNHYHYAVANMQNRGIILSRNPGVAPHRYPVLFSGKTKVSWDTIRALATYNNSAANIGVCWHAHAIGGYYDGIEDEELYLRYIQFGVFNPILIISSDGGKYYKREPWKWNTMISDVMEEYMKLRTKLVPYIYNESYMYHKCGVPLIQPLYYRYPKIFDEPNYVNQYFFGSKIMISPIVKKTNNEMSRVVQRLFIPKGIWYDYKTGKKFIGNKYYTNFYKIDDYPIFVKEGTILPLSLDNSTDVPVNMELVIFPAENGLYSSYELYEDDGISLNESTYMITKFNLDKVQNGYTFTITPKYGRQNIQTRNYLLKFRNMKIPGRVIVRYQNKEFDCPFEYVGKDLLVRLNGINIYTPIEINVIGNNLEIETLNVINEEIENILYDLEIPTIIKYKIDNIIFSDMNIKQKRIEIRKLKKDKLEPKYINMLIDLLEFIQKNEKVEKEKMK